MTVRELFEWASDHDLLDIPISLCVDTDEEGAVITNDITVTDYHDGEITLEGPLTGTASYE